MPKSLSRGTIDALLPPGDLWEVEPDESFDQQLDGIADTSEEIRGTLDSLADVRNPKKTPVFTDLERNFGFSPNDNISRSIRETRLGRRVYQGEKVNSIDDVQLDLNNAGFDLQVHKNDPPVDPATFVDQSFNMTCGSDRAYLGFNDGVDTLSFLGRLGGEWLVNTPITLTSFAYQMQCGGDVAYLGFNDGVDTLSVCGYFTTIKRTELEYPTPTAYWGKVFFIGGDATRNANGELTDIQAGFVDSNRFDELQALLMSDKTSGAWIGLIVNKV